LIPSIGPDRLVSWPCLPIVANACSLAAHGIENNKLGTSRCFNFVKNFWTAMRTIALAKNDCFILFHTVSFLIAFKNHAPTMLGLSNVLHEWLVITTASVLMLFSVFCFSAAVWRHLYPGPPPTEGSTYFSGCPFRKYDPAWIRVVRQNHHIIRIDVCDPAWARNVRR
jgi:hypothetical protein